MVITRKPFIARKIEASNVPIQQKENCLNHDLEKKLKVILRSLLLVLFFLMSQIDWYLHSKKIAPYNQPHRVFLKSARRTHFANHSSYNSYGRYNSKVYFALNCLLLLLLFRPLNEFFEENNKSKFDTSLLRPNLNIQIQIQIQIYIYILYYTIFFCVCGSLFVCLFVNKKAKLEQTY